MWPIWSSRNNMVHGSYELKPERLVQVIDEMVSTLELPVVPKPLDQGQSVERCKRPGAGWFKVNTDGAFHATGSTAGSGVVIRDERGGLCLHLAGNMNI